MGEGATSTPQLVQAPSWLWTMAPSLQASIFQSINTYSEQEEVKADGHICSMWRGQMEGSRGTLLTKSALGGRAQEECTGHSSTIRKRQSLVLPFPATQQGDNTESPELRSCLNFSMRCSQTAHPSQIYGM